MWREFQPLTGVKIAGEPPVDVEVAYRQGIVVLTNALPRPPWWARAIAWGIVVYCAVR